MVDHDKPELSSRRQILKAAGLGGMFTLAGCQQAPAEGSNEASGDSGGDSGGSDSSDSGGSDSSDSGSMSETKKVTYGVISPMTGPYGGLAEGQRKGAKLAIEWVNNNDELNVEIEGVYEDTEADPSTGRRKAKSVVEQDGATYLMGAISSSTALALNDFAQSEEVIYNPGGAAVPITGSKCNEYVFRAETHTAQVAEAVSDYTVNNLGKKVWFHIADYAYGDSVKARVSSRMQQHDGVEIVGETKTKLGAKNFDSYISQISNSDADVVVLGMTGGDLIGFVKQAVSAGLKDELNIMSPTMTFQVVRGALGEAAYGTYGGVRYVPAVDTGDNQQFVSDYKDAYGAVPDSFARVAYQSIRMTARGIHAADSADPNDVKAVLPGMEMDTVFGRNQFRECDQQAMNPVWFGECVKPSEGSMAEVKFHEKLSGSEAIPPCEDLGCSL